MNTEEKVHEGVDGFFTKLTEAADVVTEKLIEVTPEAADAILNLVQFKGVFYITVPAIVLALWIGLIVNGIKFLRNVNPEIWGIAEYDGAAGDITRIFVQGGVCFAMFFPSVIWAIPSILSFYNWLSALYPEGAIALKALQAVGIDL